jgi:hypothetical protein
VDGRVSTRRTKVTCVLALVLHILDPKPYTMRGWWELDRSSKPSCAVCEVPFKTHPRATTVANTMDRFRGNNQMIYSPMVAASPPTPTSGWAKTVKDIFAGTCGSPFLLTICVLTF